MAAAVSNTAYGIIKDAMIDAGLLQEGEDPNSEQIASYLRRLCDLINLWQTQGIKLFLLEEMTVPLVSGVDSYQLASPTSTPPARHLRVEQARVVSANDESRPIYSTSWDEWNRLPIAQTGNVTRYLVDKQPTTLTVRVWNIPDSAEGENDLVFLIRKQVINPQNVLEDMQFPQEWRIALRWGLADDICTGQPQAIMDRCQQYAETYRTMLEDFDVEDTPTSFEPDLSGYAERNFT